MCFDGQTLSTIVQSLRIDQYFVSLSRQSFLTAMAMLDSGITKLYYTISEVANLVEEEAHVLRYWESEFDTLRPRKNRAGKRVYTKDNIDTVFRIRHLLRDEKFTIDGARQMLKKKRKVKKSTSNEVQELKEMKGFLEKMLDRVKVD